MHVQCSSAWDRPRIQKMPGPAFVVTDMAAEGQAQNDGERKEPLNLQGGALALDLPVGCSTGRSPRLEVRRARRHYWSTS